MHTYIEGQKSGLLLTVICQGPSGDVEGALELKRHHL